MLNSLPTHLVIGPMKAGTSWIHEYLERRGDVCLPSGVKETFYFERNFHRGSQWYSNFFASYDSNLHDAIVECAPTLFHHSADAPQRIRDLVGDVPIIVCLRDPKKRAFSHYLHLRRYGYTQGTLRETAVSHPEVIGASMYGKHLENWSRLFSNISVLWQDQLRADIEGYADCLCDRLELPYRALTQADKEVVNGSASAANFYMARAGRVASHKLRAFGLYGAVNVAKSLGLKKIFFGGGGAPASATKDDLEFLDEVVSESEVRLPQWAKPSEPTQFSPVQCNDD